MNKSLTIDEIKHLSKLAGIELTPEELKKITPQLTEIINYVEELKKVNTDGIEPTNQTTGLSNVVRQDKLNPENTLPVEDALYNAPERLNNMFKVPIILKKD